MHPEGAVNNKQALGGLTMPDKVMPGPLRGTPGIKEAVCIHTKKIYDSCRLKECIQDMRVYLTRGSQEILDRAIYIKPRCSELLWVYIDVEPIQFNKGCFSVDCRFIYRINCDAYLGGSRPCEISGVAAYNKRVVLFGGEGSTRSFSSVYSPCDDDTQLPERSNAPVATCEVVEPVILSAKVVECCNCPCPCAAVELPDAVTKCFQDELVFSNDSRQLYATVGQFGIIRLERDTQLLIPAYDFCIPEKNCDCPDSEDPCDVFDNISFPTKEFFPGTNPCDSGCN